MTTKRDKKDESKAERPKLKKEKVKDLETQDHSVKGGHTGPHCPTVRTCRLGG